ncbi:MAG: sodium-dependent transporter [Oceanococcus sp.]
MTVKSARWQLTDTQAVIIMGVAVIGLGDIWRLPSLALNNGGGAFLIIYLSALLLLGAPVLMAEMAFGKLAGARYSQATRAAVKSLGASRWWLIGVYSMPLAGLAVIALYGAMAGWSFGYVFRAAGGITQGLNTEQAQSLFLQLASDPERSLVWHTLFWLCIGVASAQGWRHGILRASMWFGGLMVLLSLSLADALPSLQIKSGGMQALFSPRWGELSRQGVWDAVSQACFTLSVGLGIAFVTGRHLPAESHTARIVLGVVAIDIVFSLIIGMAVAALLGDQPQVASGVSLVFVDMVVALSHSKAVQVQFFCLLLLLSASSAVLLIEPFVQSIRDRFQCSRVAAAGTMTLLAWLLGLLAIFSFGPWQHVRWYGMGVVDWLVYLGVNLLVPLNCLLIASFVGRALPPTLVVAASGSRLSIMGPWYIWLRFPVRLLLVLLLLQTSGIMDAVLDFFQPWDSYVE